jgi:hypothetical protein
MSTLITQIPAHSTARLILAAGPGPLIWPSKDPADVFDYQIDFTGALPGAAGNYIESADVLIDPDQIGDLSLDNVAADGCVLVLWLSGGKANVTYIVTITANSTNGLTILCSISLSVIPLSVSSIPTSPITTITGESLSDDNGYDLTIS